jgi:dTMP kinase
MPDLTILVDIPYETSLRRIAARADGADRLEREGAEFHKRIREGFLELAGRDPRVVVIDGERSPEEVLDAAMAALSAVLV